MQTAITLWSVRLALSLMVVVLAFDIMRTGNRPMHPVMRRMWHAGFWVMVVHVVCAFAFYHRWSHREAYLDTARKTEALLGIRFGDGIYFNYLFLLLWCIDLFLAERWSRESPRWRVISWLIKSYLVFIAFNATVVFETGWTRWNRLIATIGLVGAVGCRWWRRHAPSDPAEAPRNNS